MNKLLDEEFMANATISQIREEIQNGADARARDETNKKTLMRGGTTLMTAVFSNTDPDIVDFLVRIKRVDVNATDIARRTALMAAATSNSNPEVIRRLFARGAKPNAKDAWGQTARNYAKENPFREEIDAVLREYKVRFGKDRYFRPL